MQMAEIGLEMVVKQQLVSLLIYGTPSISYAIFNSTIEESLLHQPCEMPLRKELKVQQKRGVSLY